MMRIVNRNCEKDQLSGTPVSAVILSIPACVSLLPVLYGMLESVSLHI